MYDDIDILIDEATIEAKVAELAGSISRDYAGRDLLLVCVLKAAAVFTADLMRALTIPSTVEFVSVSSYRGARPGETIDVTRDIDTDISGKHLLLVDTIVDSGRTLDLLCRRYRLRGPAGIKTVVLLDKPSHRAYDVPLDYVGFQVPDRFVIGYGLDMADQYRNLPFIGALKTEEKPA